MLSRWPVSGQSLQQGSIAQRSGRCCTQQGAWRGPELRRRQTDQTGPLCASERADGALQGQAPAWADDDVAEGIVEAFGVTDQALPTPAVPEPPPAPAAPPAPRYQLAPFSDSILAYSFSYPTATASGTPLSMVVARAPERYSSAAPLSADARQRIVSELFDLRRYVTVSMTVGPASGVLKGRPLEQWKPREVALTVLIDRSTARLSTGQRTALNDVEDARLEQRPEGPYWIFEHISQGSPTVATNQHETYRHALAAASVRPGLDGTLYLYTLNLSCPQPLWDDLEGPFRAALATFRLDAPGPDYVAPDKDPWRFF